MSTLTQLNPFALAPESDVPLGVQLAWRLRALISTGRLAAGEPLPSLRRVAGWAGVNVGTVRSVYDSLEAEGLIVSQQGRGTFVAESFGAEPELEAIAMEALRRGQSAGRDPQEVATVVMACANMPAPAPAPVGSGPDSSETIEVRHELRRQIARLEADLAAYVRDLPELYTASPRAEGRIAGVDELERTRDTLIAKLSEARKAAGRREGEETVERMDALTSGPLANAESWWTQARHGSRKGDKPGPDATGG